ncbi:hypothetical protein FB45DRAFT_803433 [Roridomyces roridus]|uniref:Uncharacterized protein n=1 Tax=Roridomyces roridus TaxID=1738132 RepID=A0AAD7B6F2_9AGAR|nr:hypothetical protein FB45DRAFT_803433 [Roridomyces roridus]
MLSTRPAHSLNEGRMPAKTPGRENNVHRGAMTVHGKGKQNAAVPPVQPFSVQPQKGGKNTIQLVTRPLGDKTPFPNRAAAPLPEGEQGQKIAKLVLHNTLTPSSYLHPNDTPDSVARPSSARKHVRIPRSVSKSFQTPLTNGNPWDVSELEIEASQAEEVQVPAVEMDDYDEVEYMPPNTLDVPYSPPFDFPLPDYKAVGANLLNLAHSYPYDDAAPVHIDPAPEAGLFPMPELSLPAIELDDPFFVTQPVKPLPTMSNSRQTPLSFRTTNTNASNARSTLARPTQGVKKAAVVATSKTWVGPSSSKPASKPSVRSSSRAPVGTSSKLSSKAPLGTVSKRLPVSVNAPLPLTRRAPVGVSNSKRLATTTTARGVIVPLVVPEPVVGVDDFVFDV